MTKSVEFSFVSVALQLSERDNIAVAKVDIARGTRLRLRTGEVCLKQPICRGQRFALEEIRAGKKVFQYGYPFGFSRGIKAGALIDAKSVSDYRPPLRRTPRSRGVKRIKRAAATKCFEGYYRREGKVGTRNYYLIVPTSLCASDMALKLANKFHRQLLSGPRGCLDGVVAAAHTEGCGCSDGVIIDRLMKTLRHTVAHPNVGGALFIDLGCEKTNRGVMEAYLEPLAQFNKPVDFVSIQALGGTRAAMEASENIIRKRLLRISREKRRPASLSDLIIGLECGASDTFSGITANPLIGKVVDRVVDANGSAILTETPEMIGAENVLISRMRSKAVIQRFLEGMRYYRELARRLNVSMTGNFVAGNVAGGLVNLTLKSLGAVMKSGTSQIVDFIDYADLVRAKGVTIMNGPGNDLEGVTGLTASGANLILFSTGMGTTEGSLITPIIKIATRSDLYERMKEDIDFNAGVVLEQAVSLEALGERLLDQVLAVASGRKTWSEKWDKRSFQIWSAGKLSL